MDIKTGKITKGSGIEVRLGDILQGKQSCPVLVTFDENSQKYWVVSIDAKTAMDMYGLVFQAKIQYGSIICELDDYIQSNPNCQVLFNAISFNMDSVIRNIGESYDANAWKVLKLEGGNYNG